MQTHSLYHDELDEAIWVHFHRRCIITRCCVKVMISQAIIWRLRHVHTFTTTPTTTSVRVNVRWTRMEWYNGERGRIVEDLASMIGMWVDGRFDTVSVRVQRLCCDGWKYFDEIRLLELESGSDWKLPSWVVWTPCMILGSMYIHVSHDILSEYARAC